MSNMGYCRFQNTTSDLFDCFDAIMNLDTTSAEEVRAAKRMMTNIVDLFVECQFVESEDVFDALQIERVLDQMLDKDKDDED